MMKSIYLLILYQILCFPGVSVEALLMLHERAATVYNAVRKGLKAKHIAEFRLTHGRHITKYLVITPDGIRFLQFELIKKGFCNNPEPPFFEDGCPTDWTWIYYLTISEDKTIRFRVSGVGTEYMLRVCGISITTLFWTAAGAATAVTLLPETIQSPYCAAVRDALREWVEKGNKSFAMYPNDGLVYEDAFTVKNKLLKIASPELARAGRYTGILKTPHTVYTVYYGSKDGMSWTALARKRDLDATAMYRKRILSLPFPNHAEDHGIMLVQNPKMFADLFLDKAKKNRNKKGYIKCRLGEGYKSFTLFPAAYQGRQLAERYIVAPPEEATKALTEQILRTFFQSGKRTNPDRFLILHHEDEIYQCIYMNTISIYAMLKTNASETFKILCLEWQVKYYECFLDFVSIKNKFRMEELQIVYAEVRVKEEVAALFEVRTATPRKTVFDPSAYSYIP